MRQHIDIDADRLDFCGASGGPLPRGSAPVVLHYGESLDWEVALWRGGSALPVADEPGVLWELAIDVDKTFDDEPMVGPVNATVENGKLVFSFSCNTEKFLAAVNGRTGNVLVYAQIARRADEVTEYYLLAPAQAAGCVYDGDAEASEHIPHYYTKPEVDSRLARKLEQVTVNGITASVEDNRAEVNIRIDLDDYTAFSVYANSSAIQPGTHAVLGTVTESIPAQMTCKFLLRSEVPNAQSDVYVDWGDGSKTTIATGTLDWTQTDSDGEVVNVVAHTYAVEGKYNVTIYGHDYFHVAHHLGAATQNANYKNDSLPYNKECNLLCDIGGLRIASCVTNLSSFARCAQRLVNAKVDQNSNLFGNVVNVSGMFLSCHNMLTFSGIGSRKTTIYSCSNVFRDCRNMTSCDFVLPTVGGRTNYCEGAFYNCQKLAANVSSLIPATGFSMDAMDFSAVFYMCSSLTGQIPADLLWGSDIKWGNTSNAFAGSSLRATALYKWGGRMGVSDGDDPDIINGMLLNLPLIDDLFDQSASDVRVYPVQYNNSPAMTTYKGRKCAYFNSNALIAVPAPNGGDLDFSGIDKDFSVCFWVAKVHGSQWECVVSKRIGGASADWYLGCNYNELDFYNGSVSKPGVTLGVGEWTFVCYVFDKNGDSGSGYVYLNGEDVSHIIGSGLTWNTLTAQQITIGGYLSVDYDIAREGNINEGLTGYLSDVRIYNRVLSVAEMQSIMRHTARWPKQDKLIAGNNIRMEGSTISTAESVSFGTSLAEVYRSSVTVIPPSTSAHAFSVEGVYKHSPENTPTYTMPAVTDDSATHLIDLTVTFSANVLSCSFLTAGGAAITPRDIVGTVSAGTKVHFLCEWCGEWVIYPLIAVP
jgi:hypothetical protein